MKNGDIIAIMCPELFENSVKYGDNVLIKDEDDEQDLTDDMEE